MATIALSPQQPRIAASFWSPLSAAALTDWQQRGLDIAELRLDKVTLSETDEAAQLQQLQTIAQHFASIPTILTLRATNEGGAFAGDESKRARLIAGLLKNVSAVDIELAAEQVREETAAAINDWRSAGDKTLILSHHNFEACLTDVQLDSTLATAIAAGADAVKIACLCRSEAEFQTLSNFTQRSAQANHRIITIGMAAANSSDEWAHHARRELPKLGSCLAFAKGEEETAAGQLSLADMVAALK